MKTMIRLAACLMAASFVGLTTSCRSPEPVYYEQHVDRYHYYNRNDDSSVYPGAFTPRNAAPEGFEPVESF